MRTQADDLKARIKGVDLCLAYYDKIGVNPKAEVYKYSVNRRDELVSMLNNIR